MYERGKSDGPVVPAKLPNKAVEAAAEAVEERGPAKGNAASTTHPGRSAGHDAPSGLDRVREVARGDKDARFTALLHHVSLERLVMAYWDLSPRASPGVDGVTWQDYGQDLVANLRDLHDRVHSGRYRARPSRRAYIPKADGRLRPLGIATDDSYCPPATTCRDVLDWCGAVLVRPTSAELAMRAWQAAPAFPGCLSAAGGAWCAGRRG
jgi:RNA-directed DNA polymerase